MKVYWLSVYCYFLLILTMWMRVNYLKKLYSHKLEQRETELAKYIIASYYEITSNYRTKLIFKVKNYVHKYVLCFQWFINSTRFVLCRRESEIPGYVCIEDVEHDAGSCCRYSKARLVGQIWESQRGVAAGAIHRLPQLSILNS